MTGAIVIHLAGNPQGKGRPRFSSIGGKPRAITPAATRSYEAVLRHFAQEAMIDRDILRGPLKVIIEAAFPIPVSFSKKLREMAIERVALPAKKPDWDNLAKVCDALNGVVWGDDAQIVDGRVLKVYSERPGMTITVEPLV